MPNIEITTKEEDYIMKLVDEIISLSEPNTQELSFKDEKYLKCMDIVYVLGEKLKISGFYINNKFKRDFILPAIKRYKKYKIKNYNFFKKSLLITINNYMKKGIEKYNIIFPINIEYNWIRKHDIKKIDSQSIELHDYDYIYNNYLKNNLEELEKYSDIIPSLNKDYSYYLIPIYERTEQSAFVRANSTIELYRGFINFSTSVMQATMSFGKFQGTPLSKYGPSKIVLVFDSKNIFKTYFFRWIHEKHIIITSPFKHLWDSEIEKLSKIMECFQKSTNTNLNNVISQVIHFYNYALDETEFQFRFLYFWQILENIFYDPTEKFEIIKIRLKKMFKNSDISSNSIDIFFNKRNKFVHNGESEQIEEADVIQIKYYVDGILLELLLNFDQFNSKQELLYYFDNLGLSEQVLDRKITLLNKIRQLNEAT